MWGRKSFDTNDTLVTNTLHSREAKKWHMGQVTPQFWRADSGKPLSECVSVDHGRDENRALRLISFRNDFPGQRVAAVVPSGCVGQPQQLVRQGVAVHPARGHSRVHCRMRIRPVTSCGYHTCPCRAAEAVGGAAGPSGGRTVPSIVQGTSQSLADAVAEAMLASRSKSVGVELVVIDVIGE